MLRKKNVSQNLLLLIINCYIKHGTIRKSLAFAYNKGCRWCISCRWCIVSNSEIFWSYVKDFYFEFSRMWEIVESCLVYANDTVWKVTKYQVLSGPYIPALGLKMEIYSVNLRIRSKYGKIRTRRNFALCYFSHSVCFHESPNCVFWLGQ